jgi:hypothetical protein
MTLDFDFGPYGPKKCSANNNRQLARRIDFINIANIFSETQVLLPHNEPTID